MRINNLIKSIFQPIKLFFAWILRLPHLDVAMLDAIRQRQLQHPNPLCKYGGFGFPQADEDGITLEIIRRLNIEQGSPVNWALRPRWQRLSLCPAPA